MVKDNYYLTKNNLDQHSNLLKVKYYKLPYGGVNSNKEYIIKVSTVDSFTKEVSAYIEVTENNMKKLIKVEEWTDKIEYNNVNLNNSNNIILKFYK